MSREALVKAEEALLSWGVRWYEDWRHKHGHAGAHRPPSCHFVATDVQIDRADPQLLGHLHQVRYLRGPEGEGANVATQEGGGPPLVCVHGFGTGIGQFSTALPAIRARWTGPVFALDWFGCGLSSRPPWTMGYGEDVDVDEAEDYFVDPLEAWRAQTGIERMVLLGHSIGGYLAICYALRFPQHVERLILVSPVGFPHKPPGAEERFAQANWRFRLFVWFWDRGWSPFTAVKIIGRAAMRWYVNQRYKEMPWIPRELLCEYLYLNWTSGPNSGGGTSQNTLLQPGAWARRPWCDRCPMLQVPKVSFVYGTRDWMDSSSAAVMAQSAPAVAVEMVKIADGGHNMMVDNPIGFAEAVLSAGNYPAFGATIGHEPLALESGRSFQAGQEVQGPRGSRRDWQWSRATVVANCGDGTCEVRWHTDNELTREGMHLLRHVDEDVAAEQIVRY
mmetsp:Transcript_98085/g.245786  ORF Transcript_98085/g.245786 Transcript_98085/m.245786 type:complete len:447 (-) Transcript_98085:29-1369(-)